MTNQNPLYTFADETDDCCVLRPDPPRHWYNYLWNEDRYCAQISQLGHGRSYYLSERADMCQINSDSARYLYLRDDEDNVSWNLGFGPLNTPVEDYECRHGIGFSRLAAKKNGIAGSWEIFVPKSGHHEVWCVKLRNESDRPRRISLFSAVSFALEGFSYPRYYEMYRCIQTTFDRQLNGVYCDSAHPFAPHGLYHGFLASTDPVAAFDGDLNAFCGSVNTLTQPDASATALFARPDVVVQGRDCTNSTAALFIAGGVLQNKWELSPGEERQMRVVFGIAADRKDAQQVLERYRSEELTRQMFEQAQRACREKYSSLQVQTPDEKIDRLMNQWVQKQVDFCIVGKKGVRDNLQIAVALLNYRPDKAREEILECLRHQFRDGHAVLTWYPYDDTRYSDQPFWIIWAVCELVKETGDLGVLDKLVEWQDGGCDSVWRHVQAAAERLAGDKGAHGLVKLFFADWNDALNITDDPEAESVMLSHQFCLALRELAVLADNRQDSVFADWCRQEYDTVKNAINRYAWDGEWYARALSKKGDVGVRDSQGSKIYLNAQTWAVLSGVADGDRLPKVLAAVDSMERDFGFPLNDPPYAQYDPHVGRMSGMLPGLFENGGVYCHATGFKILMDCCMGRADKAVQTLKKIMPDSETNPSARSGAEPYVFTNCYASHSGYFGRSYQSWTTGTSAWCLMGLYEGVLGLHRTYAGLRVAPCFPSHWEHAEVTRHFRGAEYHIVYSNPRHLERGSASVTVDGKSCLDGLLPDFADGKRHEVVVLFD